MRCGGNFSVTSTESPQPGALINNAAQKEPGHARARMARAVLARRVHVERPISVLSIPEPCQRSADKCLEAPLRLPRITT